MTLSNPYADVDWSRPGLRGNLHAHSVRSDGRATPQAMMDAYARIGHGFTMLSDHDIWSEPADLAALDAHGMILLAGQEVSREGRHLLQVGGQSMIAASKDRQQVIDGIRSVGGLAVLNHPNWFREQDHWLQERLMELQGYAGIEVVTALIDELEGDRWAFNRWDRLLGHGRRVWGFANDDAHGVDQVGRAWNVVYPQAPGVDGIIAALGSGRFAASTGLDLGSIAVDGDTVTVSCPQAERIIAITDWGRRVAQVDGQHLRAQCPDKATYLRFACLGGAERGVWTQPFFRV